MYSIAGYGEMINDRVRTDAYAAALARTVTPGCTVLDIGTGTGILALLAARHGARHVYAIEPSDAIQAAREIARANGMAERISFFQDLSTRVKLPEPVDVVVSDLHGILPLFGGHIPAIVDARTRLLRPGGCQIPQRETMMIAVVSAPEVYRKIYDKPWIDNAFNLDLGAARPLVVNQWIKRPFDLDSLVTAPQAWAELNYTTITSPDVSGCVQWTVERPAVAHGLAIWFDTLLWEDIGFSNAPGLPEAIYGKAFFPWPEAVPLAPGDRVAVELAADLVREDYIWRWNTCVHPASPDATRAGGGTTADPEPKADFKQSTWFGVPLSPASLRKLAADFQPELSEDGEIERLILSMCDGRTAQEAIARALVAAFPTRFADWPTALGQVGAVSQRYSR